jgi:cytochrome c biogenesis protein CcmG/thiol:disulfide interchange protein DsbE
VVGVFWALLTGDATRDPIEPGLPAPGFSLLILGGDASLSLESLRGKVVLLNFWATWCKPCEDEMPAMENLYRAIGPQEFELIAVSVDDDPRVVEEFRARLGLTFPILLDPQKRVADAYQSHRFPESYLIDREGVLVARYIGPRDWDAPAYVARIRRLLEMPKVD